MDDILGFLFIAAVVVISLLGKLREQKRAARNRRERVGQPQVKAKDLPEATRRQIYGSPEIPTARSRGAGPPAYAPRAATPRVIRPSQEQPRPLEMPPRMAEPRPSPPPLRKSTPQIQQRRTGSERPPRSLRERFEEVRGQLQQAFEEAIEEAVPERKRPPQQPVARPQGTPRHLPAKPPQRSREHPPADRQRERPPRSGTEYGRRPERGLGGLCLDLDSVRRGIVMSEVLGPPKGLQ